jgi:hypothetical protein
MMYTKVKDVFVSQYTRIRYGRLEHVTAHWRLLPHQYAFNF